MINIRQTIRDARTGFKKAQQDVAAFKQKRQVKRLQKLREKRIALQGQAKLNKFEAEELAKIDRAREVNRQNSPIARFQKRVKGAEARLNNISKTVSGDSSTSKYRFGNGPEYGKGINWDRKPSGPTWGSMKKKKRY